MSRAVITGCHEAGGSHGEIITDHDETLYSLAVALAIYLTFRAAREKSLRAGIVGAIECSVLAVALIYAARGREIYTQRCVACHRVGDRGVQLGPDLVTVKSKGRDGILTAILDPNKEVAPPYIAYTVNTKDGQTLSGIIANDTATSMTLKMMGGAEINIPRSNIKGSSSTGISLMPEGIEAGMDVQAMADLLTFIEELK